MIQTWAMIVDSYRELNARKLFWATMGLSGIVVASVACLGINESGPTVLWWQLPIEFLTSNILNRQDFYKIIFISVGFSLWLTWAAMILALISTANIIPDFASGGAIELSLSKPISRLRLFLTKYCAALLFVGLQVTVFSLGAFAVIGLRGGAWEPRVFLAVPLVVLVFSYLYCISTLVGLITRSGMAALLVTGLIWLTIFVVHTAETGILLRIRTQYDIALTLLDADRATKQQAVADAERAAADAGDPPIPADSPAPTADQASPDDPDAAAAPTKLWAGMDELNKDDPVTKRADEIRRTRRVLADFDRSRAETEKTAKDVRTYHALAYAIKTVLPKTSETMGILSRNILTPDALTRFQDEAENGGRGNRATMQTGRARVSQRQIENEMDAEIRSRGPAWIIGTSLIFQAVVLGAACWIFCRRDF